MTQPATPRGRAATIAYVLGILPPLFWAGNFLLARAMRDEIPPFQMSFWRWVVAFLILLPFCLRALPTQMPRIREEMPFLALIGAVGILAFNCFIYAALHHTTVINAAIINSLMPVVTFIFAALLLRDRLGGDQMLGVAIAFGGALVVIARGEPAVLMQMTLNRGDLLVVGGLTFWAAYTVLIRWRPTRLPLNIFLIATIGFGILFHLPLIIWEFAAVGGFAVTPETAGTILFIAVFSSILAYIFWNMAVAALGPGRTGMFMYLMPIFSAVLGVGFLGEHFALYHLIGIGLIFAGIALVTRPKHS
jgi:drug/metabolite transporter (DMT)-like permease